MVTEGNASPSTESGRVGVTVKVRGNNLVFNVAQDALEGPSNACFTTFLMSSYLAGFSRWQIRSTTNTFAEGTWKAMSVSFLFSSGMALPTVLAAPVDTGMMFWRAPQTSCHSFPRRPSTVFWVTSPSTMPELSWVGLASGIKQLVVQEASLMILRLFSHFSWIMPIMNMGASAEGVEIMTLLAPPLRKPRPRFSMVVKMPVDSIAYSVSASPHLILVGSCSWKMVMGFPLMTSFPLSALTVQWDLPWVEILEDVDYVVEVNEGSLMATISTLLELKAALVTRCSIWPNLFTLAFTFTMVSYRHGFEKRMVSTEQLQPAPIPTFLFVEF